MKAIEVINFYEDGCPVVSVPLTNIDKSAVLYREDFDRLMTLNVDPRWRLGMGRVLERGRGQVPIARLVANAKKGEKVQHIDKNPYNMKRENLVNTAGAGKNSIDKVALDNKILRERVEVLHTYIQPSWETESSIPEQ
jgi:hypothetical protein